MRTYLLAASLALAAMAAGGEQNQLTTAESSQWKRIEPSVVVIYQGNVQRGVAALIDSEGLFLAHRSVVGSPVLRARTSDGWIIELRLLATDTPSQLVLLRASSWDSKGSAPIRVMGETPRSGELLFAVIPSGVIRAQYVSGERLGVVAPQRRLVPLSEIRFEAPLDRVGGALVFTMGGELIGAMQATLGSPDQVGLRGGLDATPPIVKTFSGGGGGRGGGVGGAGGALNRDDLKNGPSNLTVAYIVGQDALRQVVRGFLSPSHEVAHPTIGMICREAFGNGALVETVRPGSPADRAGIHAADILIELGGTPIRNQLDFAKAMLRQEVGKTIQLRLLREDRVITRSVTIGAG